MRRTSDEKKKRGDGENWSPSLEHGHILAQSTLQFKVNPGLNLKFYNYHGPPGYFTCEYP